MESSRKLVNVIKPLEELFAKVTESPNYLFWEKNY